ncbi:hypothetical protein V8F20_000905 [Naviculisporaceae sp. PSN 640]
MASHDKEDFHSPEDGLPLMEKSGQWAANETVETKKEDRRKRHPALRLFLAFLIGSTVLFGLAAVHSPSFRQRFSCHNGMMGNIKLGAEGQGEAQSSTLTAVMDKEALQSPNELASQLDEIIQEGADDYHAVAAPKVTKLQLLRRETNSSSVAPEPSGTANTADPEPTATATATPTASEPEPSNTAKPTTSSTSPTTPAPPPPPPPPPPPSTRKMSTTTTPTTTLKTSTTKAPEPTTPSSTPDPPDTEVTVTPSKTSSLKSTSSKTSSSTSSRGQAIPTPTTPPVDDGEDDAGDDGDDVTRMALPLHPLSRSIHEVCQVMAHDRKGTNQPLDDTTIFTTRPASPTSAPPTTPQVIIETSTRTSNGEVVIVESTITVQPSFTQPASVTDPARPPASLQNSAPGENPRGSFLARLIAGAVLTLLMI